MWDNSLVVFSADNGGWPSQAGDNYPLIGGKFADLEGGTRVLAFATGWFEKRTPLLRGIRYRNSTVKVCVVAARQLS
jgi:hypothetical protein